jgi:hypothetical protein
MLAVVLALMSAVGFGASDYAAGAGEAGGRGSTAPSRREPWPGS